MAWFSVWCFEGTPFNYNIVFSIYSSIAQSVERAAVNRVVVGSSPTRGVYILLCGSWAMKMVFISFLLGLGINQVIYRALWSSG